MVQTQLDELIKEHDHIKSNLSYTDKFFQMKMVSLKKIKFQKAYVIQNWVKV